VSVHIAESDDDEDDEEENEDNEGMDGRTCGSDALIEIVFLYSCSCTQIIFTVGDHLLD
jgi:hypothetical protein